ncbi:hypothetical protein [Actinoplanes siamensis]|uniref:hypothetical protein n=1 Tax=Actinoplanes siamensis TaxID=1223317 RepID=UPI00194237B8|nr:hypothetical protein [Actinoplanes siamensis]
MIDVRQVATARPGPALAALSVGTFAIGMTELVIMACCRTSLPTSRSAFPPQDH